MRPWWIATRLAKPMTADFINAHDIEKGDIIEHKYSGNLYEVCGSPLRNCEGNERVCIVCRNIDGSIVYFGARFVNANFNIVR